MFPRLLEHALFDKLGASKFAHTCLRSDCAASTMTFSFCVASSRLIVMRPQSGASQT